MKRLVKFWSVLVTVVLMASMLVFAAPVPVSAAVGSMSFTTQPLPTNTGLKLVNGSDVADVAVSADGSAVYVVDNSAATGLLYKSTDAGMTFTAVTAPAVVRLEMVSVASDSADSIVVSDGLNVWVSTNGGSLWTALPQPAGPLAGTHTITSVAVGPNRSGTLLGREYAVSVANNTTNNVVGGDVLVLGGTTASWVSAGVVAGGLALPNTRDYMSVKFSPNFVGDRSVVALGAMSAGVGGPNVAVQVFNTAGITATTTGTCIVSTVLPAVITSTLDFAGAAAAGANIVRASIALPTDYDATTSSGRRSYAGFSGFFGVGGVTTDNDVYRVDDTTATRLSAFPGAPIWSVSYGGTVDVGTLFMGRGDTADVRYTTNPTSASPTWTATKKIVPTTTTRTLVMADAKFATTNKVYCGTTGVESAFSISTNGGLTFNQTGIIDIQVVANTIGITEALAFTPDGKTIFVATRANVAGLGAAFPQRWLSLWKSTTPTDAGTWIRMYVVESADTPAANNGRAAVKVTSDYATTNCVYFFDKSLNGNIYRSTDGGDIFASRLGPSGISISLDTEEDANVMYVSDGGPPAGQGPNIYKSTTGGWTWESPVNPAIGALRALTIGNPGELLCGGLGFIAYSKDGAKTFTKYTGFNAADSYRIAKDTNFAKNSTIFCGDATGTAGGGTGGVYRFAIGTDAAFVDLGAPNPNGYGLISGFGLKGGVLYAPRSNAIDRSLYPMDPAGQQQWITLDQPSSLAAPTPFGAAGTSGALPGIAAALTMTSPANTLYVRSGAAFVWASHDYLAAAKPKIKSPADNYAVSVDPSNGRANLVTIALEPMGTGQGLVGMYEGQITEKASGWAAGILSGGILTTSPTTPTIMLGFTAPAAASGGWVFTLNANTEYMIRFRAFGELSLENATSPWSDPITLKVQSGGLISQQYAGPVLLGPQGGATGLSLTPGFAWAPVSGATEYEVKLATDAGMTKLVGGTPVKVKTPAWQPSAALTAGTTYFWSVQATAPTTSVVAMGTFSTAAAVAKPAPAPTTAAPKPAAAPTIVVTIPPAQPAPAPQYITPAYIWAIIVIGAILVIAVVVLIVRTRRPS